MSEYIAFWFAQMISAFIVGLLAMVGFVCAIYFLAWLNKH